MHKVPTIEKILFGLGLLALLVGVDLFWFHPQLVYRLFGIEDGGGRVAIAKAELTRDNVKRKLFDRSEFLALIENQIIYSKDQIMTGPNGFLVISFPNGSVVELHADTLVEIQNVSSDAGLGNQEMILEVKKGEVAGSATNGQLKVIAQGKRVELKPPPATSVSQYLLHPEVVKVKPKGCDFEEPRFKFLGGNQDGVQVFLGIICEGPAAAISVSIKDAAGQIAFENEISLNSKHEGEIMFLAKTPGKYHALTKQELPGSLDFDVPKTVTGVEWANPPIACDGSLRWFVPKIAFTKVQVLDGQGLPIWNQEGSSPTSQVNLKAKLPLPSDLTVSFTSKAGFEYRTPPYQLSAWRDCPTLKNPANRSRAKRDEKGEILFSWSDLPGQRHYIFELSTDPNFQRILFTAFSDVNFQKAKIPGKGRFFWRVRLGRDSSEVSELLVE